MSLSTRPRAPTEGSFEALEERIHRLERELELARAREAAWRERELELEDFVEQAVVGLHKVAPDGTILWANAADARLLGYEPVEYVGRSIMDFHADPQACARIMARLLAGEALREEPAVLRCKDGSLRYVLISSNGHFENGRFVNTRCFTIDVTRQRETETALRQAQTHLAAVVESSDDSIIATDLEGRIRSWNRGATNLFGYSAAEAVGQAVFMIIPPELHAEENSIFEKVRAGERVEHYETQRIRKDGTRFDLSLTVSPVRDISGHIIGVSKVGRDITEAKRAQRELADAARRKDEFLAILAHELRNPLAPIRYALSIAKQPQGTPEQRREAERVIERQVEQMGRLLDDLLDVSRIARGHVELRRKWVDLTSVIGAAIDSARPLIDLKEHALSLDLPREALRLEADPVRLTQILANLLTNAAKYTDRGGQIQLRAWREGESIALAVRDNGIGIAPAMIPRLFNLFAQAETALTRSEGGLGVGLALVKGFVHMHGGTVEARSDGPGTGSEFIVRLPAGGTPKEDREEMATQSPEPSKRLRVLVADDNVDAAETCAMLLRLWDHEVQVAHTGREALSLAEAFKPQVALIDIGMPQLNGYQVAEAIRAQPWGRRTRLVAVTGWGQDEDKQQAREAGFDHHVTKPVDPTRLQPLLESIC